MKYVTIRVLPRQKSPNRFMHYRGNYSFVKYVRIMNFYSTLVANFHWWIQIISEDACRFNCNLMKYYFLVKKKPYEGWRLWYIYIRRLINRKNLVRELQYTVLFWTCVFAITRCNCIELWWPVSNGKDMGFGDWNPNIIIKKNKFSYFERG